MTLERLRASLADRYRIERELGQGGMATVYLAHDLRHDRQVAIKVLHPDLTASLGPERFLREITTTANLRHPHILPLYDSGRAGGSEEGQAAVYLYYVMPYIEGESLSDRLGRERQLPIEEALRLTCQVADALAYAHGRGIIHRDIKPANILLERGHAVVADFGIARAVTSAAGEKLTRPGLAVGTPAYMSPEQSVGEEDLDGRSDLYALGSVLYEMLAGEPPYTGATEQAIIAKRFREPVPRVSTLRETVPPGVESALTRVLAKAPADRFQTAEEFVAALQAAPQAEAVECSIAVLPFRAGTGNTELEALAEGLTEETASGLSRFSWLRVIAPSSVARYATEGLDPRAVGRELGATYLMLGRLRQAGNVLRATVQLIEARTGTQLWAENFDRDRTGLQVFQVQEEIAGRVAATVADPYGVLTRSMAAPTRSKAPDALTPEEAVLRFFLYQQRVSAEDFLIALTAIEHAVARAPDLADTWACLGLLLMDDYRFARNLRPEALDRALSAAYRAIDADPANQLGQLALAQIQFYRRDLGAFRAAAERALALNRWDGNTTADLGLKFAYGGEWERGLELTHRAMALNPLYPGWYRLADFLDCYRGGRLAEALSVAEQINLPGFYWHYLAPAIAHAELGQAPAARAAIDELLRVSPGFDQIGAELLERQLFAQPELLRQLLATLRKAGLRLADPPTG